MKILFVITGLQGGGAERQVCDLADAMVKIGHTVRIYYLVGLPYLKPKNNEVTLIGFEMRKNPLSFIKTFCMLRKEIQDFQPDIVHSHMVHATILVRLTRIFTLIPKLICTAHSSNEGGIHRMLAYRLTNCLGDVFTNVSESAVASFERKGAVRRGSMICMYNGIDIQRFEGTSHGRLLVRNQLGIESDTIVFLGVGRLVEQKNFSGMLRAYRNFSIKSPKKTSLIIVGEGPLNKELRDCAKKLEIEKKCHFVEFQLDMKNWYSAADYFLLTSNFEGFGLVVAEALASGTTVISTDCGGVSEILGDAGLLCPVGDSEAFSDCIVAAVEMEHLKREQMNRLGRERVSKFFSIDVAVSNWIDIYNE